MYRLSRLKYIFPIGLFVCLFLDGALSHVWAPLFFSYPYSMVSELVLLWLVLSYFFQDDIEIPLIPFAIAAGAVYDLYFSGILGLYIFLYPLVVEITKILSFQGHILDSDETLLEYLKASEDLERKLYKLYYYAHLKYDQDTTNAKYQEMEGKITLLLNKYGELTSYVYPEFMQKDFDYVKSLIDKNN